MPRKARTAKETVTFLLENGVRQSNGCLICHLSPGNGGYIQVNIQGEIIGAHRLVFIECKGVISNDEVVRHDCDTRNCIEPDHLLSGTQQDNINDMIQRGRFGTHKSYLRETILAEKAKGLSYNEISQKLLIPYNTVRNHASPFGAYNQEGDND